MGVALRRREEPLVADERKLAATAVGRHRRVRAHVGAALLLRHAHADEHGVLLRERHVARVVLRREQFVLDRGEQRGFLHQHRNARERHRRGTQRAGFVLRVQEI